MAFKRTSRRTGPSLWSRKGLSPRQDRVFNLLLGGLIVAFSAGWGIAVAEAAGEGRLLGADRLVPRALSLDADYLLRRAEEEINVFRGESGTVRLVVLEPDEEFELPPEVAERIDVEFRPIRGSRASLAGQLFSRPEGPGVWQIFLRADGARHRVPDLTLVTMVPIPEDQPDRIGDYRIGRWPAGPGGGPPEGRGEAYAPPRGLIEVTPENQDIRVSEHFRLRDFLTKGQEDVWPKYVILSPRLLDKLELTLQEVEAAGYPVENVGVISGFRHPDYNVHGGDPSGRGALSRHMYGDAADFFIDNDGTFCMDDLTGSGRPGVADLRIIADAAERVEERFPHLIGGIGVYPPTGAHCGMVHVDTRGERARW